MACGAVYFTYVDLFKGVFYQEFTHLKSLYPRLHWQKAYGCLSTYYILEPTLLFYRKSSNLYKYVN